MRKPYLAVAPLLLTACVGSGVYLSSPSFEPSDIQKDIDGYIVGSCLASQKEPYLQKQGEGWESIIVENSRLEIEDFHKLKRAVKAELQANPLAATLGGNSDINPAGADMPIYYCANDILGSPNILRVRRSVGQKFVPALKSLEANAIEQDMNSHVMASCLSLQQKQYLKSQGTGWNKILREFSRVSLMDVADLNTAIKAEIKMTPMSYVRVEKGAEIVSMEVPVYYCAEKIVHSPNILKLKRDIGKKSEPAYNYSIE